MPFLYRSIPPLPGRYLVLEVGECCSALPPGISGSCLPGVLLGWCLGVSVLFSFLFVLPVWSGVFCLGWVLAGVLCCCCCHGRLVHLFSAGVWVLEFQSLFSLFHFLEVCVCSAAACWNGFVLLRSLLLENCLNRLRLRYSGRYHFCTSAAAVLLPAAPIACFRCAVCLPFCGTCCFCCIMRWNF